MCRSREQVYAQIANIKSFMTKCLNSIGMKQNVMRVGNFCKLFNGLYGSNFIIGKHDRCHNGIRANRFFKSFNIDDAIAINGHIGYLKAFVFKSLAGMKNGMMLNGTGDNMLSFVLCRRAHNAFDSPVISFGAAAGKKDFFRVCAQNVCNILARTNYGIGCLLAKRIDGRRVAILLRKIRQHFLQHFTAYACCCGIV